MVEEMPKSAPPWSFRWLTEQMANALLGQFRLPGWLLLLIAIFIGVPDWHSRYEFWLQAAKSTGGYMSVLAAVLLWPYFAPTLAVVAIVYLLTAGRVHNQITRHPILPVVAWICLVVCFLGVSVTAGFGFVEIYIRSEIAKGRAGIPRNTPDVNNQNHPQISLYSNATWGVTPDQERILLNEFSNLKPYIKIFWISYTSTDVQHLAYLTPIMQLVERSGISVGTFIESPQDKTEEGLMLAVSDPAHVPVGAEKDREAFEIANIHLRIVPLPKNYRDGGREWALFIGPRPIQWP